MRPEPAAGSGRAVPAPRPFGLGHGRHDARKPVRHNLRGTVAAACHCRAWQPRSGQVPVSSLPEARPRLQHRDTLSGAIMV